VDHALPAPQPGQAAGSRYRGAAPSALALRADRANFKEVLMSAVSHTPDRDGGASQRANPQRWRYIYFLLAAFDLLTVCAGLYLNHRIMDIYTRSVEVNRVWAERIAAYSHLGELAADVDAPGNDVFDNRKVEEEFVRMRVAEKVFDLELTLQRREMQANLEQEIAQPLIALLDAIAFAKSEMTEEAARIFDYFRQSRPDLAGERMATMDHKYARLNAALLELRRAVGTIQERNFKDQTAAAAELQRYEYVIGLSIVLMVLGATLYGHKVARQMQADAEERERHFHALREAEERTRSILDTAADGIVTFDAQGRIASFNKAAERLFGQDADKAIGGDIRAMIPSLADRIDANWVDEGKGANAENPLLSGSEGIGQRRDGTAFPLELSVSRISLGGVPAYTGIVRDVSDRRKAEEALGVAAAAGAASRAKSQFLANMSHEIRTPMNGVLGMAEMLLDTELTPTQRRFAETVLRSGESLLEIIDDILDFSKIEAGKLEMESVDFKPRELAAEVTQLLQDSAKKKGLEFDCIVAGDVPEVLHGAPSRLRQVLINLVGNAIKFTDRGGVAIRVSRLNADAANHAASVDPAADVPAATMLHFTVADTGIGIAKPVQARLFNAFEQADSSTTRRYGGTGLGLAISKELVEKMGGRIGVRSTLGQGAEFWFTARLAAPLKPDIASMPGAHAVEQSSDLSGARVLLAEDNPINQDVARTMLNSFGCQVYVADNGIKALAALGNSQFDIVFMDCQMPVMDGFDATAEIRARRLLRPRQPAGTAEPVRLPIVGLTANALKGDREICIAAGMDDYLAKPFRRDALKLALERWVLDRADSLAETDVPEEKPQPDTFDPSALEQMRLSQRAGAPRIVAGLINSYFADAARLIDALCEACERADADALAHAAHALSLGSDFVGARNLARMCDALEQAALAAETSGLAQRIVRIRQEYEAAQRAMEAMRATLLTQ
jgi:PAS domain S-box-containing protein